MTKKIIQKENEILRQNSKEVPISEITQPEIQNLIEEMKKALATQPDGAALAAPQIGVSKRIFIINPEIFKIIDYPDLPETVFINSKITKISKDRKKMEEGCLSVRPLYGLVRRASRATIEAYNEKGEKFTMTGSGLLAQIFQHETDHFNGILFTDKSVETWEMPYQEIEDGKK